MRSLWLSFLLAGFGLAQTPSASLTLTGPVVAPNGSSVSLTVSLMNGNGPAGLQWDMSGLPTGAQVSSSVTGKTASCNATRCILSGTNTTAIPDGPIATIKYTEPSATVTAAILATLGATPAGTGEPITAPMSITIPVQSNCDLNGDGKVDATDIGLIIQQALASTTATPTILDVVRIIIAANGGACLR